MQSIQSPAPGEKKIQGAFEQQWKPNTIKIEQEPERSEPIQSRSFKVLQKLTEGIEDGKCLQSIFFSYPLLTINHLGFIRANFS